MVGLKVKKKIFKMELKVICTHV